MEEVVTPELDFDLIHALSLILHVFGQDSFLCYYFLLPVYTIIINIDKCVIQLSTEFLVLIKVSLVVLRILLIYDHLRQKMFYKSLLYFIIQCFNIIIMLRYVLS